MRSHNLLAPIFFAALCSLLIFVFLSLYSIAIGLSEEINFSLLLFAGLGFLVGALSQVLQSRELSLKNLRKDRPFMVLSVANGQTSCLYVIRRYSEGLMGEAYLLRVPDSANMDKLEIGVIYAKKSSRWEAATLQTQDSLR